MKFLGNQLAEQDKITRYDIIEPPELERARAEIAFDQNFKDPNAESETSEEVEQEFQDERILYDPVSEDEIDEDWPEEEDDGQPDVDIECNIKAPQETDPLVQAYKV